MTGRRSAGPMACVPVHVEMDGTTHITHTPLSVLPWRVLCLSLRRCCHARFLFSPLVPPCFSSFAPFPTPQPPAASQVVEFISEYTNYKSAQLAGNSVHIDRMFLQRHMPAVLEHLHYRIVDVSTIQELARHGGCEEGDGQGKGTPVGGTRCVRVRKDGSVCLTRDEGTASNCVRLQKPRRRWCPRVHRDAPKKKAAHTAMSDIKESVQELQYYRDHLFAPRKR